MARPISIPLLSFDVSCPSFLPSLFNRAIALAWIPKFRKSKSDGNQRKDIVLDPDWWLIVALYFILKQSVCLEDGLISLARNISQDVPSRKNANLIDRTS